ncbi:hypothetical protein AB0G02_04385 [Actinosynnema sp. NPDC023658]|uniref:hypothetical protein n=1 Tax=Actinosynnema sp. NPDC023658 TaxID=3155465 RepID=UPI0033EB0F08
MPPQSVLVTLLVAGIPAIAAIAAAIVAGVFASRTRRAEGEAQRARDLESRISDRKYAIYEPMINLLSDLLGGRNVPAETSAEIIQKMKDFSTWISIYGSDESVRAFHNWMQAIFASPPVEIQLRLYGDFLVAARRDIGYADTEVGRQHLLGMRINDIYKYPNVIDPSFKEVCERVGWQAPWLSEDVVPHPLDRVDRV